MYIETDRLILREFEEPDAQALYEIKYDGQVLKYDPVFIGRDAGMEDIKETIALLQSMKDDLRAAIAAPHGALFAICLKDSGQVTGAVTVNTLEYLYETQMGWMMNGKYTGKGYASEAGAAVSDYLLETLQQDYISVVMDTDNPASFRTALKSGFKLFEKRYPFDYYYCNCNPESYDEVTRHFREQQTRGYCDGYFYFRKFNKNSKTAARFYGDTVYDGRFS